MTQHIVLYGKGGVGKTTIAANVSAAMAEAGFSVMQIGCDPKGDSCLTLNDGVAIPTVFDQLRAGREISVSSVTQHGFNGISCVELGNPFPSSGCATSETLTAFERFRQIGLFEAIHPDYVLYDIPGDYACCGYYELIRQARNMQVFVVTSADFMSLHAANTILGLLQGDDDSPERPMCGMIPNALTSSFEGSFISDFARHINTQCLGSIPRSLLVRQCELYGKTVIEASPRSNQSCFYRRLAKQIIDETLLTFPRRYPLPMQPGKLREWAREWGDRIHSLENGLVTDGAAI
jgi:nitrogenase iron protein NifH